MTSSYVQNQAVRSFYQVFVSGLDIIVTEFLQEIFIFMIYSEFEQYLGRKKFERSKKFTYEEYRNGFGERTISFKWSGTPGSKFQDSEREDLYQE